MIKSVGLTPNLSTPVRETPRATPQAQVTDSVVLGQNRAVSQEKPQQVPSGVPHPTPLPEDPKVRSWQGETIYFLLIDRFHDGDPENNHAVNKDDLNRYHGGDLQGVIDKMDYIKSTGATALWITPPMDNQTSFVNSDGYHGYWPIDHFKTDEHVGTMDKFKEFVNTAHEKGLKVLLDIPLNHTAWEHPFYQDPTKHSWYHHNGDVTDWDDPWQSENCSIFGLPDLAQENPEVEKYLIDVGKFWADTGVDGFRLDAVKNVPKAFWDKFNQAMHEHAGPDFYLMGEYYVGDPSKYAQYQHGGMDGLVDYPLYYTIDDVLAKGGSMRQLADRVADCDRKFAKPEMMSAFLDNHDTKRFLTKAGGDRDRLKLALSFQMTLNRIPSVYYGTEVGMESDNEGWSESSRRMMDFDNNPDMLAHFQKLGAIRKDSIALREGRLLEMWQDDQIYSYARVHPEDEAVVVLNNSPHEQTREIPVRAESRLREGMALKELLTGETVTIQNGRIHSTLGGKQAAIYMPMEKL